MFKSFSHFHISQKTGIIFKLMVSLLKSTFSLIIQDSFFLKYFPALSALIKVKMVKHKNSIKSYQQIFFADSNPSPFDVFRSLQTFTPFLA